GLDRAPVDRNLVRAGETRAAADQRNTAPREISRVNVVQARDVGIALALQRREIEPAYLERKAVLGRVCESGGELGGVPHDLLWHAADIDAGSTEASRLDDNGTRTVLRGALRTGEPAAAATDDGKIVLFRHFPFYTQLQYRHVEPAPFRRAAAALRCDPP